MEAINNFALFRMFSDFAQSRGMSILGEENHEPFLDELRRALEKHQQRPTLLHGLRIQSMFMYVAASLGECAVITEEDSGDFSDQQTFQGALDEIRIYDRVLTESEVRALLFPIVNDLVALAADVDTAFDPTPVSGGPAGTFTITATFTNTSATPLRFPFFAVTELSRDNLLLNADEGIQGVGAILTPELGDDIFAPGASMTVDFVIGLQVRERFTFFVDVLALLE